MIWYIFFVLLYILIFMFRIITTEVYDGCIPVTVWIVQKRVKGLLGSKWVNVKGYDNKVKAEMLLRLLR